MVVICIAVIFCLDCSPNPRQSAEGFRRDSGKGAGRTQSKGERKLLLEIVLSFFLFTLHTTDGRVVKLLSCCSTGCLKRAFVRRPPAFKNAQWSLKEKDLRIKRTSNGFPVCFPVCLSCVCVPPGQSVSQTSEATCLFASSAQRDNQHRSAAALLRVGRLSTFRRQLSPPLVFLHSAIRHRRRRRRRRHRLSKTLPSFPQPNMFLSISLLVLYETRLWRLRASRVVQIFSRKPHSLSAPPWYSRSTQSALRCPNSLFCCFPVLSALPRSTHRRATGIQRSFSVGF